MNAARTLNIPSLCELQDRRTAAKNSVSDKPSESLRRRILSYSRVSELVSELIGQGFDGRLVLQFEAGYIVRAKPEQSIDE
jgi:hypothetical protein